MDGDNQSSDARQHGIGIVGCGRISARHLAGYASLGDRARVVAVYDKREALAAQRAEEFGVPNAFGRLEEIVGNEETDVVAALTPPDVRLSVVRPLLEAGKHILVEKPFANSLAEAEIMVAIAAQQGVTLAVNQNFRFLPESQLMKRVLEEGRLGQPIFLVQNSSTWRNETEGWRNTTERLAMAVMGVHWLDRFRWLLGQEAHTVFCKSLYSGLLDSEGEDLATMVIQFSDGCLANLTEHWCAPARGAANSFQLDCTEGSIIVRDGRIKVFNGDGEVIDDQEADGDIGPTFAQSMAELLDAIDEGREPSHSGYENLGTMALLDAAYLSAERGSRVEIGAE